VIINEKQKCDTVKWSLRKIKQYMEKLDGRDFGILLLVHWKTRSYKTLRNYKTYMPDFNISRFPINEAKKSFWFEMPIFPEC
jgi:hypothetical protein